MTARLVKTTAPARPALEELLEWAKNHPPDEAMLRLQRISFVTGQMGMMRTNWHVPLEDIRARVTTQARQLYGA